MAAKKRGGLPKSKRGAANAAVKKAQLKAEFLNWYEKGGAMYWAAAKIGVSKDTVDRWRTSDAEFDEAVLTAYQRSTDTLKQTAYLRAINGLSKGSDTLMMFLIKQRDPSYRESFGLDARHLHAGAIANPTRVPAPVQAAVDAMSIEAVKKLLENM